MQVTFDPPLQSTTQLTLPPNSDTNSANKHELRLFATLSKEDYSLLKAQGAEIQVWSDISESCAEWDATPFREEETHFSQSEKEEGMVIIDLTTPTIQDSPSEKITLFASFPLPSNPPLHTFQFTYRIVYPDGGIWWQGQAGENGNGRIELQSQPEASASKSNLNLLVEEDHDGVKWGEVESGGRRCDFISLEDCGEGMNIAKLDVDAYEFYGWVIGADGSVYSSQVSTRSNS